MGRHFQDQFPKEGLGLSLSALDHSFASSAHPKNYQVYSIQEYPYYYGCQGPKPTRLDYPAHPLSISTAHPIIKNCPRTSTLC